MKFRTRSDPAVRFVSCAGSAMRDTYERRIDEECGYKKLFKTGRTDRYAEIQALAGDCSVYAIVDKYRRTGDDTLLNKSEGRYIDVTDIPTDLRELEQFRVDTERLFLDLPPAIRELFGNNPRIFYADPARAQSILDDLLRSRTRSAKEAGKSSGVEASGGSAGASAGAVDGA